MKPSPLTPWLALAAITTKHDPMPVASTANDWCAYFSDYEAGAPIGWGGSELAAVGDLLEQTEPV